MQFTIHRFECAASTNDLAVQMAKKGAPEGTVVVAREQTAGRGRYGQTWVSPAGSGLYLSLILRPDSPFETLWQIGFVGSLAAAESVQTASGLQARIKWPNDILLGDRKVCGLLVETFKEAKVLPSAAIVGIGINVNMLEFPREIAHQATSIAIELGSSVQVSEVERALLEAVNARYTEYLKLGFPTTLRAWRQLDCTLGRRVKVNSAEGAVEGTAVKVDGEGALLIRRSDGILMRLAAGKVMLGGREASLTKLRSGAII